MSWQEKYLPPQIDSKKITFRYLWKLIKKVSFAIKHSLWFHEIPKEANSELPDISSDDEKLYEVTKNIYDESLNRINKLEEKSFKLLSYYTALFAFLSFIYFQTPTNSLVQLLILSSLVLLLISILISFRCLNIKNTQQIYINSIYNFDIEDPVENFNRKKIIKTHLECATYNENVADNTVDMLNGARYTLVLSLVLCLISSFFVANNGLKYDDNELTELLNKNLSTISVELKSISDGLNISKEKESEFLSLQKGYEKSKNEIDSLQNQIRIMNVKLKKAYNPQINRTP